MGKLIDIAETWCNGASAADAKSIHVVFVGDDKGLVVAKYPAEALMAATTDVNEQAFVKMIATELVDVDSVSGQSGPVIFSFRMILQDGFSSWPRPG